MPTTPTVASRRTVLRGAAWSAPAIVLATAAPAMAASGPASVTTNVPAVNNPFYAPGSLTVTVNFVNANTGATGLTTTTVTFTPSNDNSGGLIAGNAPTNVSAGWTPAGVTGNGASRSFSFTRATPGIAGAGGPTGSATTSLTFTITTQPDRYIYSRGVISVVSTATSGTIAPGTGSWS